MPHGNSYRTKYDGGIVMSLLKLSDEGDSKKDNINIVNILMLRILFFYENMLSCFKNRAKIKAKPLMFSTQN